LSEGKIVLYRCPTRTNVLCPCGAVARKLGSLGLEYRVERLPYRRAKRPEIEELTRQRRVPVLVDGDEIIHDSRRIRQYLDWKYGEEARAQAPTKPKKKDRPRGLYNVKQWRRRKKQSS
jgi:glutathione S-transferase